HPARSTQPRTYILRRTVGRRVYGAYRPGGAQNAPVVRVQGIDAAFTRRSYAPGEQAELRLATDARSLRLQVFAYQSPGPPSEQDVKTSGSAKTGPIPVDWSGHRNAPALLRVVRAGDWPSGLYFVRAQSNDGRVGYAPFIVRPRRLGEHRVAVVLATNTWAAYNFGDADGNGWADLAVLAANNLYRDVTGRGDSLVGGALWRNVGLPASSVVAVQYVGSNQGAKQAGFVVTGADAAPWAFAGTNLSNGDAFGRY